MRGNLGIAALATFLFAGNGWAQDCAVTVEANDQIQFVQKELTVSSDCDQISVTLKHIGTLAANIMGHNWVLTTTPDYMAVAQAGQASGPPNFVPSGDARVLAATDIVGGGEETTISFDAALLSKDGEYTYFCSFPGHFVLMYGKLIVE